MILGTGNFVVRDAPAQYTIRNTKQGFTLIEVMLAVSILAIGLIGVLHAYAALVDGLAITQDSIRAICLLKDKMAGVEEEALKELDTTAGTDGGRFEAADKGFEWRLQTTVLTPSDLGIIRVFEEGEEEPKDYLSELKLTVFNEQVKPARRVTVYCYMDGYGEE